MSGRLAHARSCALPVSPDVCWAHITTRAGGFNFYWAWVSGRLAGLGAAHAADTKAVNQALRQQKQLWAQWEEDW